MKKEKTLQQQIADGDPICANCHYYGHHIGVGFGIRCNHPQHRHSPNLCL